MTADKARNIAARKVTWTTKHPVPKKNPPWDTYRYHTQYFQYFVFTGPKYDYDYDNDDYDNDDYDNDYDDYDYDDYDYNDYDNDDYYNDDYDYDDYDYDDYDNDNYDYDDYDYDYDGL